MYLFKKDYLKKFLKRDKKQNFKKKHDIAISNKKGLKNQEKKEKKKETICKSPSFSWNGYVASNVGLKRANNEDNFLLNQRWNTESALESEEFLYIPNIKETTWCCVGVFDGMGGGENGELASIFATEEFKKIFDEVNSTTSEMEIEAMARQGFLNANRRIVEEQQFHAMYGTTGTVICTNGTKFKVFHLGDSRAYLFREKNEFYKLTKDQTLANLKLEAGFYSNEDEIPEKEKHQLTEYIGCDRTLEHLRPIESEWMELLLEDKLLICSDGLYDMCTDEQISNIMKQSDSPKEIVEQLVASALEEGGIDNITCLLLKKERNVMNVEE